MPRPPLNRDTTLCISLSGRPSNHGIKFHNYLYEKHGLDYLYKAMTTTDIEGAIAGVRAWVFADVPFLCPSTSGYSAHGRGRSFGAGHWGG